MRYTQINGQKVSKIALGCMNYYIPLPIEESEISMDQALDAGINLFDTARVYGSWLDVPNAMGLCERILGDYMKKRGNRDKIVLATKGSHPPFDNMTLNRLTKKEIVSDLDASLKDLGTDYVDIWFLHRDNPACDLFEVMDTLNEQVKAGKIRTLGASNWTMKRILEANKLAEENGLTPFRVSQIEWSMAYLEKSHLGDPTTLVMDETELAAYKAHPEVALMLFSSQSRGFFQRAIAAGGFEALKAQEIANGRYEEVTALTRKYDYPCNRARLKVVEEIAKRHGVDPAAVGIAYLTCQPDVDAIPILGYSKLSQLSESMAHMDLTLTPDEIKEILGGEAL